MRRRPSFAAITSPGTAHSRAKVSLHRRTRPPTSTARTPSWLALRMARRSSTSGMSGCIALTRGSYHTGEPQHRARGLAPSWLGDLRAAGGADLDPRLVLLHRLLAPLGVPDAPPPDLLARLVRALLGLFA